AVEQVLELFMLLLMSIPMILKLLLAPIIIEVGVEKVEECIPSLFREAFFVTVTIHYEGLTCGNENSVLAWIPLDVLLGRCLGLAWRRIRRGR
ncbi:Hypothetical predicted protein, partial [Olea europaea subsp. europaea]